MPDDLDLLDPVRRVYDEQVASGLIKPDRQQLALVKKLDQLIADIDARRLSSKSSSLGWLFGKKAAEHSQSNGLYIWGGVGSGKSHLMDIFYAASKITPKRRVHFNDFMQEAHELIHLQRQQFKDGKTKEKDPVTPVAKILAAKSSLLCFDEFSVTDIADAMLLGRLFKVLYDEGVVIVSTSNVEPSNLYHHGLNRNLFLPFIDLLRSKMDVHQLTSQADYRLAKLPADKTYSWPLNEKSRQTMDEVWDLITDHSPPVAEEIALKGRKFKVPQAAKGVARFHFDDLCRRPAGVADYLAIAKSYHTIMIDGIATLSPEERNEAKRFILLIDVLYDNQRHLVVSAEGPPDAIYQAKGITEAFEFDRTASRLIEMQSKTYNEAMPLSTLSHPKHLKTLP